MLLAAMTACLLDGRFRIAANWAFAAALFSSIGMIHGYRVTDMAIINAYGPETTWPFVIGYLVIGAFFRLLGLPFTHKSRHRTFAHGSDQGAVRR